MLKKLSLAIKENKVFTASFVSLLIPITLQNVISYALNMADTVMFGFLEELELSAISLSNPINPLRYYGVRSGAC